MAIMTLLTPQTPIIVADSTYSPTSGAKNDFGTRTHDIDLTSLAHGAYRQGAKIDFEITGTGKLPRLVAPDGCFEWSVSPSAQWDVRLWMGWSNSGTPGEDNPGNLNGTDGAWNGYGAAATDADQVAMALHYLGSIPAGAQTGFQVGNFAHFTPRKRYGIPVVQNYSNAAFIADAVEMAIRFIQLPDEFQN